MKNRRTADRTPLVYHLVVRNSKTGKLVGFLGNLTAEGALLFSQKPVRGGRKSSLTLEIMAPAGDNGRSGIPVDADKVWSARDARSQLYASGFQFREVSERTRQRIKELISSIGAATPA